MVLNVCYLRLHARRHKRFSGLIVNKLRLKTVAELCKHTLLRLKKIKAKTVQLHSKRKGRKLTKVIKTTNIST